MKKRIWIPVIGLAVLIISFVCFTFWQNNNIKTTEYIVETHKVQEEIRIVQISDLHNKNWGEDLIKRTKDLNPNYIVLTGDMVDYYTPNIQQTLNQIEPLVEIAPVYFVQGNHEGFSVWYDDFVKKLWEIGVTVLDDTYVENEDCFIIGVMDNSLDVPLLDSGKLKILLAHRPEHFDFYAAEEVNLVLSGHTHGGQLRLPLIGGVYAPNQGFFPKYLSGKYEKDGSTLIISNGLGNGMIPIRIFNQPEIVLIRIVHTDKVDKIVQNDII